jgi:MFS family permease
MVAACAFALAITFFGLATSYWLILGAYLVWAIAFSLLNGTESAFLYDTLKSLGREDEYAHLYGRGWAIQTVAAVAGTLIGAPVAAATSLALPILLSGGLAAFAFAAAFTFREPPRVLRSGDALTYTEIIRGSVEIVRHRPAVRYAILFVSVTAVGSLGPIFFFQPFLLHHNVAVGAVGIWQTPMRAAGFVAALAVSRIVLSLGERRTFYLMPVALIGSYALLASWDSVYAQVAFPVMNIVFIVSQPTLTDYLNRRVPSEQRATVVSLTNLVRSAVLIPSAPLMGRLADEVSLSATFAAGGIIVAILSLPILLLWLPHLGGGEDQHAEASAETVGVAGD